MLGINGGELLILAILAVVVLGPERLPDYAAELGRLVRELRRMATGARDQLREEVGADFDDVNWKKLDPREYDPRRIIKEALLDEFDDAARATTDPGTVGRPAAGATGGGPARAQAAESRERARDAA